MTRRVARAVLALACAGALVLAPARPAAAATRVAQTHLSWVRVGAWVVRKWGPMIVSLVEDLLERLPAGGDPPPPPEAPPTDVPPVGDPEYTP